MSYLYHPKALELINSIQPDARFIVSVRNPIDMLNLFELKDLRYEVSR